ncbi:MAG: RNA polymerase sigma factor [Candidatus Zhuqueibacterota bacterium]
MEQNTDKELMKRVIDRDTRAFEVIYCRYELFIFNFILKYSGNRELAQDLLQETFTRVWVAAHTFNLMHGNFKGWVLKIALNLTRNELSRKRYDYHYLDVTAMNEGQDEIADSHGELPDHSSEQSDLKHVIGEALGQLSPVLREIIVMKHFQQLKFKEIAEITETPEGTLKARFHRAISQLREILAPSDLNDASIQR